MKRALIVMACLAAVAVAGAIVYQSSARERDYRQLLAQGDAALAAAQTFTAIEDYSGAIALRPDSMLAHLRRGETYLVRGDLDDAGRDFRTAATLDQTATRPLEQWGEVLYRQQRFRRAAEVYESRLRLDDRSADVHYRLGLARYRDGSFGSAIAALQQAAALEPTMAEAHYVIGLSEREQGRFREGEAAFAEAIRLAPGLIAAREELADIYARGGRRNEEVQQLQVLAGLDDARVERRIAVGMAHARAGHADLAVLTLASTLEQAPDHDAVYGALGRVWLDIAETRQDRPDALAKALEALARAASAAGATSDTKTLYGRALLLSGQTDTAERMLQQAIERSPVEPLAYALYARVAERQGHVAAARESLIAYTALTGDDAEWPERAARIGRLSMRLNDFSTAAVWFGRAAAAAPTRIDPLLDLAEALLKAGNRDGARDAAERAQALAPDNARARSLARRLAAPVQTP